MQNWRFFYGRMAILKRLKQLRLVAPEASLVDGTDSIADKISSLSNKISDIMRE